MRKIITTCSYTYIIAELIQYQDKYNVTAILIRRHEKLNRNLLAGSCDKSMVIFKTHIRFIIYQSIFFLIFCMFL